MFSMSGAETVKLDDLIQGVCSIYGYIFKVLYDSRVTHSFIVEDCIAILNMLMHDLPFELVVTTSVTSTVKSSSIYT